MKKVRAAVIGCGELGRTHADCINRIEGAEIVVYCDYAEERYYTAN